MGGRGSSSASGRRLPMGASGLISTDASDYAGIPQGRIMDEIARLPYEAAALFSSSGDLIGIAAEGNEGSTTAAPSMLGSLRYAREHPEDSGGTTHFHNHPIREGVQGVFSSNDIGIYANSAISHDAGVRGQPTKNVVKTSDGRTYVLEYVGGGRKSLKGFQRAYSYEEQKAHSQAVTSGTPNIAGRVATVDRHLERWLSSNASDYGFRFSYSKR